MLVNKNIVCRGRYVLPYASKCRQKLDVCENYWPAAAGVHAVIREGIQAHKYPYQDDTYQELIGRIAEYAADGCCLGPENITLTGGSDNALKLLIEAFVTGSSRVCIPNPTYPHFVSFVKSVDRAEIIEPRIESADDFVGLDLAGINLCYLVSPNLPLGYDVNHAVVDTMARKFPYCMFIVDEAYIEYSNDRTKTGLIAPNLVVVRTFSKAFGLAGLRLGYIVATADVTKIVSPLVNDKNVTQMAVRAANAALADLTHYSACIKDCDDVKNYLRHEFDKACMVNVLSHRRSAPIYGYSISSGNFFMLYATNSQQVCDTFAAHGIMIRNKDGPGDGGNVPDGIRVCMGPKAMMSEVVDLCRFINRRELLRKAMVAFDLDNTLRCGASSTSPLLPGAEIIEHGNYGIITNNAIPPVEVTKYFASHGLRVLKPITSLGLARDLLVQLSTCVYGRANQIAYIAKKCKIVNHSSADCILLSHTDVSMRDIVDICAALAKGARLVYTDSSMTCDINCSIEFGPDAAETGKSYTIPDMGSIIAMIREAQPTARIMCADKTCLKMSAEFVVGDSIADEILAKNIGAQFIMVGCPVDRYNFDARRMEVTGVDKLI